MKKPKCYKCAYGRCAHPDKIVSQEEAIKHNGRYWHKDCCEISMTIEDIKQIYLERVSQSVVIQKLMKIINDIVFGKKLLNSNVPKYQSDLEAVRYLLFCVEYATKNGFLSHEAGLYYIINNQRIKKEWDKKQKAEVEEEIRAKAREEVKSTVAEKPQDIDSGVKFSNSFKPGFGGIFGGN